MGDNKMLSIRNINSFKISKKLITLMITIILCVVTISAVSLASFGQQKVDNKTQFVTFHQTSSKQVLPALENYDVNGDDTCDLLDLVLVSESIGKKNDIHTSPEDVNSDGVIDAQDLDSLRPHVASSSGFQTRTDALGPRAGETNVSVDPASLVIGPGESFSVDIIVEPSQPIKSVEFKLSFDPSLVQATSVAEGDLFSGFSTLFNAGVIDNVNGTIVDVYGLIVGTGNVSDPGIFATVSFDALYLTGLSPLDLYDVGVTNETEYVTILIDDGEAQVDATAPEIVDLSPAQGYTGNSYTFNASITDNTDAPVDLTVMVDWSHGSLGANVSMSPVGGQYFEQMVTLDENSISDMSYSLYTVDSYGNSNTTAVETVSVSDDDPPDFISTSGSVTVGTGSTVVLWATASDNIGVDHVEISVDGGSAEAMGYNLTTSRWEYEYTASSSNEDDHVYAITLFDAASNSRVSTTYDIIVNDDVAPTIIDIYGFVDVGTGDWVRIWVAATDNIAVTSATLAIDAGIPASMTYNATTLHWEYDYQAPANNDANHTYTVWVYDGSGLFDSGGPHFINVTDNDAPTITGSSGQVNVGTGNTVILWVQGSDNIGVTSAKVFIDADPTGTAMTWNVNRWEYGYTAPLNDDSDHSYLLSVYDDEGLSDSAGSYAIIVTDDEAPHVSNIVLTYSDPMDTDPAFGWVNISCTVTDNIAIDTVTLNISNPDSSHTELPMTHLSGAVYYCNSSTAFSNHGNYTYMIYAWDPTTNEGTSPIQSFSMLPNWDIDGDGECDAFDLNLVSLQYGKTGTPGWIREDVSNDGAITVLDLVLVSNYYGTVWWI